MTSPTGNGKKTASIGLIAFIILMVTLAGIGQLFMKQGIVEMVGMLGGFPRDIVGWIRLIFHWKVFLGLVIYFFFGIAWLKILADVPVSFAFPFLAISYIVIILGSRLFLHEDINFMKLVAVVLIILGVICLSRSDTSEISSSARHIPSGR
jgi:drug/metabolite transporter (DMT)-like permease